MVATMIDPLLPSTAERLAALRSPRLQKRRKPAHNSKILTAGVSTTALFALIAGMGWQSGTSSAQSTPTAPATTATGSAPASTTTVAAVVPAVPATVAPLIIAAPTVALPIIPVAVAAAKPPVKKIVTRVASNTTTKTSG
jgi:hypothetical protein